jgi:hypothetical protein
MYNYARSDAGVALKLLNSSAQTLQSRNPTDNAYRDIAARTIWAGYDSGLSGAAKGTTNGSFVIASDERLKDDIKEAPNYLAQVRGTRVIKFKPKTSQAQTRSDVEEIVGFVAQEIPFEAKAFDNAEEWAGVDVPQMLAILWKAVQELSDRVPTSPKAVKPPRGIRKPPRGPTPEILPEEKTKKYRPQGKPTHG